jgi:hypothetical protein
MGLNVVCPYCGVDMSADVLFTGGAFKAHAQCLRCNRWSRVSIGATAVGWGGLFALVVFLVDGMLYAVIAVLHRPLLWSDPQMSENAMALFLGFPIFAFLAGMPVGAIYRIVFNLGVWLNAGPFVGARAWNVFKPQITGDLEQAFFTAIWNGRLRIVKAAVKRGADVNGVDGRSDGCPTALILALKGGRDEIAAYLISKGAQVNKTDSNGNTSLFFLGTCKNKAAMARLLIESGVDVNHRNDFGKTALRLCPSEAVIVLVEAGAQ